MQVVDLEEQMSTMSVLSPCTPQEKIDLEIHLELVLNRDKQAPPESVTCRIHLDKPRVVTLPEIFRFGPKHDIVELQTVEWLDLTETFLTLAFQVPRPWKPSSGVVNIHAESELKPIRVYHIERQDPSESFYHIMGGCHRTYYTRQLGNSHISAFVHRKYRAPDIFSYIDWWRVHYVWESEDHLHKTLDSLKKYWAAAVLQDQDKNNNNCE